ncbi:MAG TPA: hypothetical protein VFQ22_01975 [Longimicrobiales bacterium]|nr:hypothetical protein [Longimicrobiales bacterium]
MMRRSSFAWIALAGASIAALPAAARAQVSLEVGLFFELGDDGWHAYRPVHVPAPHAHYEPVEVVYYTPRRHIPVPRGHLPPPGYCRVWIPGVPPGRQAPPRPCDVLFRIHRRPGAVIIGRPHFAEAVKVVETRRRPTRWHDRRDRFGDGDFVAVHVDGGGFRLIAVDGRGRGRGR